MMCDKKVPSSSNLPGARTVWLFLKAQTVDNKGDTDVAVKEGVS